MKSINNFSDLTVAAIHAALKSGDIIRRGYGSSFEITAKPGRLNYVTEYDRLSENSIIEFLKEKFPTHQFMAEESGQTEDQQSEITWIIDPLDGTTNFSRNIPLFAVSIAACDKLGPICGVVFDPIAHELFVAERGKGAHLNGKKIQVSQQSNINESIIGIGFPYDFGDETYEFIDHLTYFAKQGLTLRNLGSGVLNLCYVASGRFDAMLLNFLHPWDIAAGILLVQEAGGLVTNFSGKSIDVFKSSSIIASNGLFHEEIRSHLTIQN